MSHSPEHLGYLYSDLPENEFVKSSPRDQARKLGQFFTPYTAARFMAKWVNQTSSLQRVLDPAVGLGIFFRALMDVNPDYNGTFVGYDVDQSILDRLRDLLPDLAGKRLMLCNQNFLLAEDENLYDGILCNPPYLRYKALPEREKLQKLAENQFGIKFSPYTNLYAYFIVQCSRALAPGGRAAILVPSEFLYSGYGSSVKEFLLKNGQLRHVIVFEQMESIFDDAMTTSCILLLANDGQHQPVSFITVRGLTDLELLLCNNANFEHSLAPLAVVAPATIFPSDKWSRYFYDPTADKQFQHVVPFSRIARVMRGIACGDNRFFTFNRDKIKHTAIPPSFFLPCLTRSSQAVHPFFGLDDFDRLSESGKPVFLLNASQNPDHPAVEAYLKSGEANGSHLRYLTRNRSPWYRLENRPPAPILATTFHRRELRFVRNEAGVRNLTCFHSIYLLPGLDSKADLLMAYLLTPLAHTLIRRNRRLYGNGLVKYEPNDLNSAWIADLSAIPNHLETAILEIYRRYRTSHLEKQPDGSLIAELDGLFMDWMQIR